MTTIVWDGKTLAADCLSTDSTMKNVEHRRGYVNKIYLFKDIVWNAENEEMFLAAAFSGMKCIIDKIIFLLRNHQGATSTEDFINAFINMQFSHTNVTQLYVTNKAVYAMDKMLGGTEIHHFQRIEHEAYLEDSKKDIRRQSKKQLVVLGVGKHTLKDLWKLTHHELTSEQLVFLANGHSLYVGNGIDTWHIGDTTVQHRAEITQEEKLAIAETLKTHILNITASNFPTDEENTVVNC